MNRDFVLELQLGIRKVHSVPSNDRIPSQHEWIKRQIVAEFVSGDEGDFAFACFKEGLARRGGSLRDAQGIYHVGSIGQLDGAPLLDSRYVADPAAR